VLLLVSIACAPYTFQLPLPWEEDVVVAPARGVSSETELVFDALINADGIFGQDQVLSIRNDGGQPLQILGWAIEDQQTLSGGAGVTVFSASEPGTRLLEPGDATTLVLSFDPVDTQPREALLRVATTDPDQMEKRVYLRGEARGPKLAVDVQNCLMEEVPAGCSRSCTVMVRNRGKAELRVDSLQLDGEAVALAQVDPLPWYIAPGGEMPVQLSFSPEDWVQEQVGISLQSNDPIQPDSLAQLPASSPGKLYAGESSLLTGGEVDILVAATADEPMRDHLQDFLAAAPDLLDLLETAGADFHLAVVEEDSGCIVGTATAVVPDTRAAQLDLLEQMLLEPLVGSQTRSGLLLSTLAMSARSTDPGGCNYGFRRTGVPLAVVGLTDGPETSGVPWQQHLTNLQKLADAPLSVHAFAGEVPSACSNIAAGLGWFDATIATGGTFHSLCESSATGIEGLVAGILPDRSVLEMEGTPVPSSLEVVVDGREVIGGWRYDADSNAVVFDTDQAPRFGSMIDLSYQVAPVCE
jgi:hypothetical protein